MISSTSNATTDHAEVTAKATIQVAGVLKCDDLNFGTIVVKQNNGISTVTTDDAANTFTGDIISVTGEGLGYGYCSDPDDAENFGLEITLSTDTVELTNETGQKMTASVSNGNGSMIFGTLTIPANVTAGTYTGSYTVTRTY